MASVPVAATKLNFLVPLKVSCVHKTKDAVHKQLVKVTSADYFMLHYKIHYYYSIYFYIR